MQLTFSSYALILWGADLAVIHINNSHCIVAFSLFIKELKWAKFIAIFFFHLIFVYDK